jgi:hypothetical protein
MAVIVQYTRKVVIVDNNASPRGGSGIASATLDTVYPSGTAAGQADLAAALQLSTQGACNGAELAYLLIEVPSTASGNVTVKVAASNGLDILNGSTDGIVIRAGGSIELNFLNAVGPSMDASNRLINFANAGASDVVVSITAAFRSA